MKKETELEKLVRESLFQKGWSQQELAEKMHVVKATITHWLKGRNDISTRNLKKLSDLLDIPLTRLLQAQEQFTKNTQTTDIPVEFKSVILRKVPRLNWNLLAQSSDWEKIITHKNKGEKIMDYDEIMVVEGEEHRYEYCFSIPMMSDEMVSQFCSDKLILPGTTIFVDIKQTPKNGDVVLVRSKDSKVNVGVYTDHGTYTTINFLNQIYSPIDLKMVEVKGVVIEIRRKFI